MLYLCSRFRKRNYSQITIKKLTIMKTTIFELNYLTGDNEWHNVLFADKKRAQKNLEKFYEIGAHVAGQIVIKSFVIERILF